MKKSFLYIAILLFAMVSCHTNSGVTKFGQEIPFSKAEGYFFRNNLAVPERPLIIESKEDLERSFGYATTMSSRPTTIDFSNQAALAIVLPETDRPTDIVVKNIVKQHKDTLVVNCSVTRGESASYTMLPMTMVVIPKADVARVVVSREE